MPHSRGIKSKDATQDKGDINRLKAGIVKWPSAFNTAVHTAGIHPNSVAGARTTNSCIASARALPLNPGLRIAKSGLENSSNSTPPANKRTAIMANIES